MRKAILAALALSPVMLNAQANSPAQAKPTLESRLATPALSGAADRPSSTPALRISTGVVAPKLIQSADIPLDTASLNGYTGPRKVVVGMIVGTDGVPSGLKIVQSAGPLIDHGVLEAVSHYRFTPGSVSSQPTAVPMNLEITLVAGPRY